MNEVHPNQWKKNTTIIFNEFCIRYSEKKELKQALSLSALTISI